MVLLIASACYLESAHFYLLHACAAGVECLVCLSVCLFVCQFVHHFLACLCIQGILEGSLYTQQVDQVEKVAYRWAAIEKNGLEAKKKRLF